MDDVIAARVDAYDRAVADGCVRYGSRAGHKETALQRAAKELGLKTVAPVRKALERAGHRDVDVARSVVQKQKSLAAQHARQQAKMEIRRAKRLAEKFPSTFTHASRAATIWRMHRRGTLNRSDFNALDAFRVSWELSQASAVTGMDPTRERVDGGRGWTDVSVEQAEAHRERLQQAERCLGPEGYAFIGRVAGCGETLAQAADAMGWRALHGGGAVRYASMRLKEAARTLRDIGFGKE